MNVVIDIECNGLVNPSQIYVIVCKDITNDKYYIFREVTTNEDSKKDFLTFARGVDRWIGHNYLSYDYPVLNKLLGFSHEVTQSYDTFILSKLIDYPRTGHSIEHYGEEFGIEKGTFYKFDDPELKNVNSILFKKLEEYCIRDVDICHKIYLKYAKYISIDSHKLSILLEHRFQTVVNSLHNNGFAFNHVRASNLLGRVVSQLEDLDKEILKSFPPKLKLVKEIHPRITKHGTLDKKDFRWVKDGDLSIYSDAPFCRCVWSDFNPSSHKQVIDVLNNAGWSPVDKTQTHIDTEREINRSKYSKNKVDLSLLYDKLKLLKTSGWKINETNLDTLPPNAPSSARTLAARILLESRRRTLTEWLSLVQEGRIHGKFLGIGTWTHRMAHQQPNTANIPNEFDTGGNKKLLGKELRSLWQAPKNRLLVGVDAEGIQLRIFAHYIDAAEFTEALVKGKKSDKSDPHSLNQRVLGPVCKTRAAAKRFIFALLLGAGIDKLAQILETSKDEARRALDNLMERYQGFTELKKSVIPTDAKRGWFTGLDGRSVKIPGESAGERRHLCMSGYLQNGEAVIMKSATLKWHDKLKDYKSLLVNFVHDEWQTEVPNNMKIALEIAKLQADSLREVGEELKLKCPLAGSYWSEENKDYTIGTNWSTTH